MAEHALTLGRRITIIAALASTLEPTRQLFQSVAEQHGATITINAVLCRAAWDHFERGDLAAYHATIATCLRQSAATEASDVIVLAQASMAGAALLCTDIAIPILSSPRLGVAAALEQWKKA